MTNLTGFATPIASFGALERESIHPSEEEQAAAAKVIRSWRPGSDGDEILAMLGLDEPQPGE